MSRRIYLPEDSSDPPIKLFGCNIQLPDSHNFELGESDSPELLHAAPSSSSAATTAIETSQENRKEEQNGDVAGPDKEDVDSLHQQEDLKKEISKSRDRKPTELNSGNEGKAFKKPDKILPCPRCDSMETKFCYFNNYNVNQPRHFCRSCQRYWTAGGTIRNVPVGAGRRKNKHLSPQFPQSVAITCNGSSSPSSASHLNLIDSTGSCGGGPSPTGLANPTGFSRENSRETHQGGCDTPFCNSVTTLLTLKDHNKNQNKYVESCSGSSREALSLSPSRSSPSAPTTRQNNVSPGELVQTGVQFGSSGTQAAVLATLQGFPGPPPPAAYPWNIGWTGMAAYGAENGQAILLPWGFSPMATYPSVPGATPPSIPYPFVPPYMGWNPSSWNSTTSSSSQLSPPSSASNSSCSSSSPSLGKHSREGEEAVEKCIWVPKTLRMDDPDEAAKSSIWTTLGIKPDRIESFSKGGGRRKGEGVEDTSTKTSKEASLQANPAALSRSQAFQEST